MKELTQKEVDEGAAAYQNTQVKYWTSPAKVLRELLDKYPQAESFRHVPFLDKSGNVQLAHEALDSDGMICGPPGNDTNPCPPCCPECP